ncbi:hypothetical protein S40288_01181 [Stachybotrys chartarum IBT 40288]|nr:hypothetical protein S40288_01181 [Stachybotrys chartarum IBT 40288]
MRAFECLRPSLRLLLRPTASSPAAGQIRSLSQETKSASKTPKPRPFVPDPRTFLTLIGRGLNKHASKFPSWESLFSLSSLEMKELGIEPPRDRKYLLNWLHRYRAGAVGPGGDFEHVKDGAAILKVATPPASVLSDAKWVVNVPHDEGDSKELPPTLVRPQHYTVRGLRTIAGPYAQPLPNDAGAVVRVTEGMWEHARGRKIDGGERRRAEVRFKKRSAERRAQRESAFWIN